MSALARAAAVTGGAFALLTATGFVGRYLVVRRRSGAVVRLTEAIPVNAAYWKEQRVRTGDLLYVALGDSAAQGIGASRPGRGYVGLLARDIRVSTGRSVRVVNLGMSGGRLRDAVAKQLPALRKLKPDLVTVSIGANDIAEFNAERFENELREIYSTLPASAIVADLPSFYYGEWERRVETANEIVHRVAKEYGLTVAPLHRVTRARTAARTALRDVAADFFHPNDRGYAVWASAFRPALHRAIDRLESTDAASA